MHTLLEEKLCYPALALIVLAVFYGIFLLSVLCMKDSWRAGIPDKDKTELVTGGIYRYSRRRRPFRY